MARRDITNPGYWQRELEALPGRRQDILTFEQISIIGEIEERLRLVKARAATELDRKSGHDFEDIGADVISRLLGSNAEVKLASLRDDLDGYTDVLIFLKEPKILLSVDLTTNDESIFKKLRGNYHSGPRNISHLPLGVEVKESIPVVLGVDHKKAQIFMAKFYEAYTNKKMDEFMSTEQVKGFYLALLREIRGQLEDYLRNRHFEGAKDSINKALDFLDKLYSQLIREERNRGTDVAALLKMFSSGIRETLAAPTISHGSLARA